MFWLFLHSLSLWMWEYFHSEGGWCVCEKINVGRTPFFKKKIQHNIGQLTWNVRKTLNIKSANIFFHWHKKSAKLYYSEYPWGLMKSVSKRKGSLIRDRRKDGKPKPLSQFHEPWNPFSITLCLPQQSTPFLCQFTHSMSSIGPKLWKQDGNLLIFWNLI